MRQTHLVLQTALIAAVLSSGLAEEEPSVPQLLFENGKLIKDNAKSITGVFGDRKERLELAIKRLKLLLERYPKDPNGAEAAYLIADTYTDIQFKEWEKAVKYFLKSFETDPNVQPDAIYQAAEITDKKLENPEEAARLYELVMKKSTVEKDRKKAIKRLEQLRTLGFGMGKTEKPKEEAAPKAAGQGSGQGEPPKAEEKPKDPQP